METPLQEGQEGRDRKDGPVESPATLLLQSKRQRQKAGGGETTVTEIAQPSLLALASVDLPGAT